jgi:hypothetical protein
MNPEYVGAYQAELSVDLLNAWNQTPTTRKIRKALARSLVRVGAWMMPDKPELVSDTVLVLPKPADKPRMRTAA